MKFIFLMYTTNSFFFVKKQREIFYLEKIVLYFTAIFNIKFIQRECKKAVFSHVSA